jgi:hypothetical protein
MSADEGLLDQALTDYRFHRRSHSYALALELGPRLRVARFAQALGYWRTLSDNQYSRKENCATQARAFLNTRARLLLEAFSLDRFYLYLSGRLVRLSLSEIANAAKDPDTDNRASFSIRVMR